MLIRPTFVVLSYEPRVIMYGRVSSVRLSSFGYSGDDIQENEMGGACGTWGRGEKEKNIQGFGGETSRKALFKT